MFIIQIKNILIMSDDDIEPDVPCCKVVLLGEAGKKDDI